MPVTTTADTTARVHTLRGEALAERRPHLDAYVRQAAHVPPSRLPAWLPALAASNAPLERCTRSASAIWERALLPVQRNSTRCRRRSRLVRSAGGVTIGAGDSAGCSAAPVAWSWFSHAARSMR